MFAPPADAGRMLGSATDEVVRAHIHILAGHAKGRVSDHRIRFVFQSALHGTLRSEANVLVSEATRDRVQAGQPYIVAFTDYRNNPLLREGLEPDPQAPRVVSVALVGDFVLDDRPETRLLIAGAREPTLPATDQLAAALDLLASNDPFSQRFAAMELYGREGLRAVLDDPLRQRWSLLLRAGAIDTQAQDFLFRAALRLPKRHDRAWIAEGARDVLDLTKLHVDFDSTRPALFATALNALAQTGKPTDTRRLAPLLRANHPGIAKAALAAMDVLDRDATLVLANQLLLAGPRSSELERALQAYVTRWEE